MPLTLTVEQFVSTWPGPVKAIANVQHGDYAIGSSGMLISQSRRDMRFFRKCTVGHAVLCGAATAKSIRRDWDHWLHTNKPLLSGRECWVASRRLSAEGQVFNTNTDRAIWQDPLSTTVLWVIGGQQLYEQCLLYCSEVYLTRTYAKHAAAADKFFPGAALERDFVQQVSGCVVRTSSDTKSKEQFELWRRV